MKTTLYIPSNALILPMGVAASGKSTFVAQNFQPHEIVSSDRCRYYLTGDEGNQEVSKQAFVLFHTWIEQRLSLGNLTVADATNVRSYARTDLRNIATKFGTPVVLLDMQVSAEQARFWNEMRDRQVPEHIINKQYEHLLEARALVKSEDYHAIYQINPWESYNIIVGEQVIEGPGFDFIGDVHGCARELVILLYNMGYNLVRAGLTDQWYWQHPHGRKAVFVGDLVDRGPHSVEVLRTVRDMVDRGEAFCVVGNHDDKLRRWMKGNKVKVGHGLAETITQIETQCGEEEKEKLRLFLISLPYQLRFRSRGGKDVVVCHAGIPRQMVGRTDKEANAHCIYGEVDGTTNEEGFSNRTYQYTTTWYRNPDKPILIHGHTVVQDPHPEPLLDVYNLDTGVVFGGKLTALRYPEMHLVSVDAAKAYTDRTPPVTLAID